MSSEEIVDLWHSRETFRKDPSLQYKCPCHDSFIIQELCIRIDLILPIDTPPVVLNGNRGESTSSGSDLELSASSDEADYVAVADAGTSKDPESSSDHETPKQPDAPFSLVADPEDVPVSVRASSDWEAVTTPDATFLGVAFGARAARDRVEVPRGTYSRSHSSSELMTKRANGATDFDRPRA